MNSYNKVKNDLLEWCNHHIGSSVCYDVENRCIRAHWDLASIYYRVKMPSVIVTYQISFANNKVNGFIYTNSTCEEENNAFASLLNREISSLSFVSDEFTNIMGQVAFSFKNIQNITYNDVTSEINDFEKKLLKIVSDK